MARASTSPLAHVDTTDVVLTETNALIDRVNDIDAEGTVYTPTLGVTVQDESSSLTTQATALNFTGSGVTASGTGATKTITIPGAAGGSGNKTCLVVAASNTPGIFTLADYTCDGTDDDVQIQAAIDALGTTAGGTVELLPGLYTIGSTIIHRERVRLIGANAGTGAGSTRIAAKNAFYRDMIQTNAISNSSAWWHGGELAWIYLDGNKANNAAISQGSATGGTTTTIVKTGAGWTTNQFAGAWVKLLAGKGAGASRLIASNTSDTITVATSWPLQASGSRLSPDATTTFEIRSGVLFNAGQMGEQAIVHNVDFHNAPHHGMRVWFEATPANLMACSSFNGLDAGLYLDDIRKGINLYQFGGDNNVNGLIYANSPASPNSYIDVFGMKTERQTAGTTQDPVITLDNYAGTLNIFGMSSIIGSGFGAATSCIKRMGEFGGPVNAFGLTTLGYTNQFEDAIGSDTISFGTGTVRGVSFQLLGQGNTTGNDPYGANATGLTVGNPSSASIAVRVRCGTGSPEGVVTGSIGDVWLRTDGSTSTTLYVKTSGTRTNTGWTAK